MDGERIVWPLSYEQERQWFLEQVDPENPVYNRPYVLRITGTLQADILKRCLDQIVARHEVLRARFPADQGMPNLVIQPFETVELPLTDLSTLTESERVSAVERIVLKEAAHPFELARDRLVRAALIRNSPYEHTLVLVFHHIVFDGWSAQIFLRELTELYKSFLQECEPMLPVLTLPYTQYAAEQREALTDMAVKQRMDYWRQRLQAEAADLELPFDRPRPAKQRHIGRVYPFMLAEDSVCSIRELCRSERVTPFMYLLAVFQTLLYRFTGQQAITVGCLSGGRKSPEAEKLIGIFVNTLPVITNLEDGMSFRQLLQKVRQNVLEAFQQELPYAKLVAELSPARRLNANPLFQVMINMHNMPRTVAEIPGLVIEEQEYDYGTSLVDVCLKVTEHSGEIACALIYDTDLFDAGTIKRMADHFEQLVRGSIEQPDVVISQLPLLTDTERELLLAAKEKDLTTAPLDKCIHYYFEEQAALRPDKAALVFKDQEMSYGDLNKRANQLAHYLIKQGVGPEVLAAVCLESSFERMISFLAVLKAGGAYLPLDLSYPVERIAYMLANSKAALIIATRKTQPAITGVGGKVVWLDSDAAEISAQPECNPMMAVAPENLAYVMYTSGSTGKPKGVAVLHKGIVRLVKDIDYARVGPEETFVQLTTVAFDVSAFEIYGSLLNGGTLVIMEADKPSMDQIGTTIRRCQVTSICITPEMLHLLLEECLADLQGLRQVLSAGDTLPVTLASKFIAALPDCCLINAYGPTENSVYTTAYPVDKIAPGERSVLIGRPIANDRVYILDKQRQLLPIGITGELYASGDGLARGYLYNPELTAEKFVPNPFSAETGSRLYRTGDLARYLPDGNIEFFGRADNQVKVRGCRIELGEIEDAVCQHPNVSQCIVTTGTGNEGLKSLLAYVVLRPGAEFTQNELRSFVRLKLPEYMVPSFFMSIEDVPLTPVGKIDRRALPKLNRTSPANRLAIAPRNATEKQLAVIWERLLGLEQVGVTDNFFDLGGHSLLAMRLFADIERTFHRRLSVSLLFKEDTIEKLARIIDCKNLDDASSLVPIQPDGSKPPLFCVHALDGEVISYRNLAQRLNNSQPIYGLKLNVSGNAEHITIKSLAAKYIREILCIQPKGPYFLAGHSLGGIVAYEMAQQLWSKGQKVALLILFDTKNPQYYPVLRPKSLWARWKLSITRFGELPPELRVRYLTMKIYAEFRRVRKRLAESRESIILRKTLMKVQHEYIPDTYPGVLTLFRAVKSNKYRVLDSKLGWDGMAAGGVEVYETGGGHGDLLGTEHMESLATQVATCLQAAQSGRT